MPPEGQHPYGAPAGAPAIRPRQVGERLPIRDAIGVIMERVGAIDASVSELLGEPARGPDRVPQEVLSGPLGEVHTSLAVMHGVLERIEDGIARLKSQL